ncbi:hypothetical protein BB560_002995 [Smittium megazygosporum]|uniref:Very-long-chain (3R)-3-hydroxyacyl-CoA dehydratase n=1 Tax=Smittium megazygosporum TaxID=133381 RepID=A0A2T9ZD78_9FUNG|nr:hypothetical protein BB560_002995 [Smittium megazygosporum]
MAKSISPAVKSYLIAYNFVCTIGWGYILVASIFHFLSGNSYRTLFDAIGTPLAVVQTLNLLEVVHSALGKSHNYFKPRFLFLFPSLNCLVNSGIFTTVAQISSRIFIVWVIEYLFPEDIVVRTLGFTVQTFAWSITECIRYPFYALSLIGIEPYPLIWARYTFFYVLYPLGVWGETSQIIRSFRLAYAKSPYLFYLNVVILLNYFPAFNSLFRYMVKQRSKHVHSSTSSSKLELSAKSTIPVKSQKAKKL